jgi:hypothetical protein
VTRHADICACGHSRHFHALKLVAGGYRNDQCWTHGCYCLEFEHEPAELRVAVEPTACSPSSREVRTPLVAAGRCESSPFASLARTGSPLHTEISAAGGAQTPRPLDSTGGSSRERKRS